MESQSNPGDIPDVEEAQPFQKMLVPTDFSLASEHALERARLLAGEGGAEVTLLHVVVTGPFSPVARSADSGGLVVKPEIEQTLKQELGRLRAEHLPEVKRAKEIVVVAKNAAIGICDYAQKNKVDLIVMAKRGRGAMPRTMIGSVTEKVVRHCGCAVLTFRAGTQASQKAG